MLQGKGVDALDRIARALHHCLAEPCKGSIIVEKLSCSTVNKQRHSRGGLYVFLDNSKGVLYVGQAGDLYRRIREHCSASIGASEGVVRFLMHMLIDICRNPLVVEARDAVTRERIVKRILKDYIWSLSIYVAYCRTNMLEWNTGPSRVRRQQAEECLKRLLNPILNP